MKFHRNVILTSKHENFNGPNVALVVLTFQQFTSGIAHKESKAIPMFFHKK